MRNGRAQEKQVEKLVTLAARERIRKKADNDFYMQFLLAFLGIFALAVAGALLWTWDGFSWVRVVGIPLLAAGGVFLWGWSFNEWITNTKKPKKKK